MGRSSRAHKKTHTTDFFQRLWDKLSYLIWGFRRLIWNLTQSLPFETFIFIIVCLNSIMLIAQTFAEVEIRGGKNRGALFSWRRPVVLFQDLQWAEARRII